LFFFEFFTKMKIFKEVFAVIMKVIGNAENIQLVNLASNEMKTIELSLMNIVNAI